MRADPLKHTALRSAKWDCASAIGRDRHRFPKSAGRYAFEFGTRPPPLPRATRYGSQKIALPLAAGEADNLEAESKLRHALCSSTNSRVAFRSKPLTDVASR